MSTPPPPRSRVRTVLLRVVLVIVSIAVSVVGAELWLRELAPKAYAVWPLNFKSTFRVAEGVMPGITGESKFSINSCGIRGDEFSTAQKFRILAVGGSTTECMYLDDEEAWPRLLQKNLNEVPGMPATWVGNVGRAGGKVCNHLPQVRRLLPQYPSIDIVLILPGINDLLRCLQDPNWQPTNLNDVYDPVLFSDTFLTRPTLDRGSSFIERTAIWRKLHPPTPDNSKRMRGYEQDAAGNFYTTYRARQKACRYRKSTLPSLDRGLRDYSATIREIISVTRARGTRVIFMTQPVMWNRDLPTELVDLTWMGGVGGDKPDDAKFYYTVDALAAGMTQYNTMLRATCRETGVECIDIAATLPHDTTVFYDDCHFNESGARRVAALITEYLLSREPLNALRR